MQAHWDVLPFEEFSLRVPRRDLARLPLILDTISDSELARLRAGMAKYHRWGRLGWGWGSECGSSGALLRRASWHLLW